MALLARQYREQLIDEDMVSLHDDIENPLVRVLAKMEVAGIGVDRGELTQITAELSEAAAAGQTKVQELAGHPFNVNSTKQLRTVLYDELGLTPGRKTKTGYSTDAQTLESLRDAHPIVDAPLSYREVEKLRSTYGENLLAEVAPDGRIHATFRQTVARTGRISSDRPNLHNIPVRTELGKQFRRAFVPEEGCTFLVADYDQVELRVIAHLSGDPHLIEALTSGADVHRVVAARVFGVPEDAVTHRQREYSKMVSYGLAYGMEAYGLSQRLGVPVEEAAAIMDGYFGAFPTVKAYMDETVAEAGAWGDGHRLWSSAAITRSRLVELSPPAGRGTPSHECGDPRFGRRHLQAGVDPPGPLPRSGQARQSPRAPGPRRGDRRSCSGRGICRQRSDGTSPERSG